VNTTPLPPPKDQDEAIPELVLEKRPAGVARGRQNSLPPYTGLLIAVLVLSLAAIGYAIYRDTHQDVVDTSSTSSAPAASTTGSPR
jgi:hypothetical protein